MKLSKENQKILDDEFKFVIKKMENSENPDQMLYYFTGIHTMTQRILNLDFSEELLFTHFVLENFYKAIIERIRLIKSGQAVVVFHEDFSGKLIECVKELKVGLYNSKLTPLTSNLLRIMSHKGLCFSSFLSVFIISCSVSDP